MVSETKDGRPRCQHTGMDGFRRWQCRSVAKYDGDTKCGVHSEAAKKRREDKARRDFEMKRAKAHAKLAKRRGDAEAAKIVRRIAQGHNDPMQLALDWLSQYGDYS